MLCKCKICLKKKILRIRSRNKRGEGGRRLIKSEIFLISNTVLECHYAYKCCTAGTFLVASVCGICKSLRHRLRISRHLPQKQHLELQNFKINVIASGSRPKAGAARMMLTRLKNKLTVIRSRCIK